MDIDKLIDELYDAEYSLDEARKSILELEDALLVFHPDKDNSILDLKNFRRELEIRNLMTSQLDEFIENYMRFSNQ